MPKLRHFFRNRELLVHDGATMRRVHLSTRVQLTGATVASVAAFGAVLTVGQLAVSAVDFGGSAGTYVSHKTEIAAMEAKVSALRADVVAVKKAARDHAARLEARHAGLAAMMNGKADDQVLASMVPALPGQSNGEAAEAVRAFADVSRQQVAMASTLRQANEARYQATAKLMGNLGLGVGGMGGPYEPVPAAAPAASVAVTPSAPAAAVPVAPAQKADPAFRALFDSWKKLDNLQASLISIPSQKPVDIVAVNSGFGVRRDPFRGGRAMHAGVDIPGPMGTPIYATADALVGRTGWVGGYGNLIELEHGKGIQTRYGHLSSVSVAPGQRIKRGQLIGLMGSTGRSTGSHLHYEVRIDGKAVNPVPFLRTADYLLAMQKRAGDVALGGPEEKSAPAAAAAK